MVVRGARGGTVEPMATTPLRALRRWAVAIAAKWRRTDALGRSYPWDAIVIGSPEGCYLGGIPGEQSPGELRASIDGVIDASRQVRRQLAERR